jgi:hypothetical protein
MGLYPLVNEQNHKRLNETLKCTTFRRIHNERGFISKEVQEARNLEAKRRAYTRSIIRFSFHHELFVQAQFFSGEPGLPSKIPL